MDPSSEWQAQYEFWNKIICDEVARLRWNQGFEPLEAHLYEIRDSHDRIRKLVGTAKICGRDFWIAVIPGYDPEGRPSWKLSTRVTERQHH